MASRTAECRGRMRIAALSSADGSTSAASVLTTRCASSDAGHRSRFEPKNAAQCRYAMRAQRE